MDGWKNYPSWAVALWLENDYSLTMAINSRLDGVPKEEQPEIIKEFIEEHSPIDSGLYADLLNYAIEEADYNQIAYKLKGETWQ